MSNVLLREATPADVKKVLQLIKELALYEKMHDHAQLSEEDWINDGFGEHRFFYALVAVENDEQSNHQHYIVALSVTWPQSIFLHFRRAKKCNFVIDFLIELITSDCSKVKSNAGLEKDLVGLGLYFYTYSTWMGRSALLEDIFVKPEYRRKGIGHRLLKAVAESVRAKGCSRLDLHVLDWNKPSLNFFKQHGAIDLTEKEGWHFLRYNHEQLDKLVNPTNE